MRAIWVWVICILCVSPFVQAEEFSGETGYEFTVDPDVYPPEAFADQGQVKAVSQRPARSAIPNRQEREAVFAEVPGLDLSDLDDLDRDRLYVLARTRSLPELRRSFPQLPEAPLGGLWRRLQR
jgi:hypothetical protein